MIHIVICDDKTKEYNKIILGERKCLIRGYASRKIPHSRIFINDELFFIEKGNTISEYHAVVKNAESYSKLSNLEIDDIFNKFENELHLSDEEIKKWKKKCLCLIEFEKLEKVSPLRIPKYSNLENWLMFDTIDDIKNKE